MIVQLLKPHYWMLNRAFRNSNRYWLLLLITVSLFVIERVSLDALSTDSNIALLVFGGVFGVLLLLVLDVNHTLYQLFEAREVDILMVNPVPLHTIYALKLIQCSRTVILSGALLNVVLILCGNERGAPIAGLITAVLSMTAVLVIVATLVFASVLLVCWMLPPQRVRNGLFVVFTLIPLVLVLLQSEIATWFGAQTELHHTLAGGLFTLSPWLLLPLSLAVLLLVAVYRLFDMTFREGRARYLTLTPPRTTRRPSTHLLAKEWLLIRRDPRLLLRMLQPLVFTFLVLLPLLQGSSVPAGWVQIAFWFLVIIAGLLIVTVPFAAVDLLVREGQTFALIRTQPTHIRDLLRAKVLAVWLPQSLVWALCVLLVGGIYRFAPWQMISLTGLVMFGLPLATTVSVGLAAMTVNLRAQSVPVVQGVLIMAANTGWALGLLMLLAAGVWHWLPDSDIRAVLDAVAPDLFGAVWLPGLLLSLVFGVVAPLSWLSGIRRLDQWQIVD